MAALAVLLEHALILCIISDVSYFVIKKAVKDALSEHERESRT